MRGRNLPLVLAVIISIFIVVGVLYTQMAKQRPAGAPVAPVASPMALVSSSPLSMPSPAASPAPGASAVPVPSPSAVPAPTASGGGATQADLTVDANGLSRATVTITTTQGVIKFKFYPKDAPNTVNRIIELINKGFYNGLTFHRVAPGFVIQTGDPGGDGTGGSGQKLKAEFNNRHHIEGTVAMARASDPDSADSQFYITLGTFPQLDHNYTVFGQVVQGMDVVRKIRVGDKMNTVTIQND